MEKIILDKPINLDEVLEFAKVKHAGQKRDNGDDYIVHPIRVAKIVDYYKGQYSKNREVLLAASLLHDTLEDTYTSFLELRDHFGIEVASLVEELTNASYSSKIIGKGLYLAEKMQMMTNYALIIKLADRLDNVRDLEFTSKDKKQRIISDTQFILNYLPEHRELTGSQTKLCAEIKKAIDKQNTNLSEKKPNKNGEGETNDL